MPSEGRLRGGVIANVSTFRAHYRQVVTYPN